MEITFKNTNLPEFTKRNAMKNEIQIKTSGDVYKSNPLLESSLGMNMIMGRIFTLALLQVHPILTSDEEFTGFKEITIDSAIVKNICGCGVTSYYKKLKAAVDNFKNWVNLRNSDDPKKGFEYRPLFDHIDFSVEKGLSFKFADCMAPYIAELNGRQYTRIAAKHIFVLSSVYAVRILEILLEYRNIDTFKKTGIITRKVTIDEIRFFCGISSDKYSQTRDLIKSVIRSPVLEINNATPFTVTYEVIKKGVRIEAVILKMELPSNHDSNAEGNNDHYIDIRKADSKAKAGVKNDVSLDNPDDNIRDILIYYGVGKIVAARLAKAYPREHIINNVRYSLSQAHRVRNMGAYIARAVKDDYYSSRCEDDGVKSVGQLDKEYKAKLDAFLSKYGLPAYWAAEFMNDEKISANRRNSTFIRVAREHGFDLESILISVQKRQIPEPPEEETVLNLVPESEIEEKNKPKIPKKEYPEAPELAQKLGGEAGGFWLVNHFVDHVREGTDLDPFAVARVEEKGIPAEQMIIEAKKLLGIKESQKQQKTDNQGADANTDKMAELSKLFEMYQAGFLSKEELEHMKKEIMSFS